MKNLFYSFQTASFSLAPVCQTLMKVGAKAGPFIFVFLWLQACSQSPAPNTAGQQSNTILTDSSASVLGDSPNGEFRLFKFNRKAGEQNLIDLKLLRLNDLKETLVATLSADDTLKTVGQFPKFYWSKESRYLITENNISDSTYKRELLVFDLPSFSTAYRKSGYLLNFDQVNDFAFLYRQTTERQLICYFNVNFMDQELVRELIAPPSGKLPVMIIAPLKKEAKVKAYMAGAVPINFSFTY